VGCFHEKREKRKIINKVQLYVAEYSTNRSHDAVKGARRQASIYEFGQAGGQVGGSYG